MRAELVFRDVPGKLVQRRGQSQRFRRFGLRRALVDPPCDGVAGVPITPVCLGFLTARRLAVGIPAGALPASHSRVGPEPPATDGARSLPGLGHRDDLSSSSRRGKLWWYKFTWNGEQIRESTKHANKRVAEQIEAVHKTALAKGEVNIRERVKVPTLREFSIAFEKAIETQCAEKPRTIEFYASRVRLLMASELADRTLDTIDEAAIEKYRQTRAATVSRRKITLAAGSVNRELATLRRLLRLAYEWKVINRVPRIKLLRGEKTGSLFFHMIARRRIWRRFQALLLTLPRCCWTRACGSARR